MVQKKGRKKKHVWTCYYLVVEQPAQLSRRVKTYGFVSIPKNSTIELLTWNRYSGRGENSRVEVALEPAVGECKLSFVLLCQHLRP